MVFLWIILYGLTHTLSQHISSLLQWGGWLTSLAMLLYVGALLLWLRHRKRWKDLGLCMPRDLRAKGLLPLAALPVYNILAAEMWQVDVPAVVFMLSVSVAEEIFFRGYLLRRLSAPSPLAGVVLSAAVFALLHGVNVIHGGDFLYTVMQILCAFSAGICYGAVTVRYKSLLPCVCAHFLTNLTGCAVQRGWALPGLWLCIAIYIFYGFRLCRELWKHSNHKETCI